MTDKKRDIRLASTQVSLKCSDDAERLREKCKAGPDTCGQLLAGFLGPDTPPLTDRQKSRILKAAAVHFGSSTDCGRCPHALLDACEQARELLEMVERIEAGQRMGYVSVIARGILATRRNPRTPAPAPTCARCGVEMHPFAATVTPLHLENGEIHCFVCVRFESEDRCSE